MTDVMSAWVVIALALTVVAVLRAAAKLPDRFAERLAACFLMLLLVPPLLYEVGWVVVPGARSAITSCQE